MIVVTNGLKYKKEKACKTALNGKIIVSLLQTNEIIAKKNYCSRELHLKFLKQSCIRFQIFPN